MIRIILFTTVLASAICPRIHARMANPTSYEQKVERRFQEILMPVRYDPSDPTRLPYADHKALLLLYKNVDVAEANRLVLSVCTADRMTTYVGRPVPKNRCESLLRIYLLERTRKLLTPEARTAIEDYAWDLLNQYNLDIKRADADKRFFPDWARSENHFLNDRRRYYLSLQIVRMAERFGPDAKLDGETIDSHCKAWDRFWARYFRDRANEGTDNEIAQPSSYGICTIGVYYDLYDFGGDATVRDLAGKFLTLYWAEVAAEFEPRTGQRAGWSTLRNVDYAGQTAYWARPLLYCYQWHDQATQSLDPIVSPFFTSSYRTPEILSAIARDENRGCYLSTSRRAMMTPDDKTKTKDTIIFDENGNSHFRRDVYYTPDYALSTMAVDPKRKYGGILSQTMGVTFAAGLKDRITVIGRGFYGERVTNGITGKNVSVIARDPNAKFGQDRFMSDGTRVYIGNGPLWDNRIEDKSGWFFTRHGDAFVALRVAGDGFPVTITDKTSTFVNASKVGRKVEVAVEKNGHFLDFNDMWAPVVIQMGRAADYSGFENFQTKVKSRRFDYADGKLTYVSEAGDTYEYWAKGVQPPRINGSEVNLNPPKTYDSPFLSMMHGSKKAVITYRGYPDLELELDF